MAAADGGAPGLEIRSDRLLLVEGKDEANLFDALLKHRFGDAEGRKIQIIDAGGRGQVPPQYCCDKHCRQEPFAAPRPRRHPGCGR